MRFAGLKWVGAAVAVLGIGGTALAQSNLGANARPQPQVGFERKVQLTPQEELGQGELILTHMESTASTVRRMLDAARQSRDVVKSLCLSDKLSQVDVAERSAKDRDVALQAAVQRGDRELGNHEFTILSVLRQRVEQLSAEANQCIGEEIAFIGQTNVVTEVDPNLPSQEDTTSFPPVVGTPAGMTEPPPPMTGMQ